MKSILAKLFIFFASSVLVLTLVYYHIKIIHLQQIILLLLVILLVTLRLLKSSIGKKIAKDWLLIFVVTFFIQTLIASSGAVFSPFFVLIHLYVIGLSLFFDFWTAFFFLVLEMTVLSLNIILDQNLYYLVRQDFGSVLLYFSSILVITPVSKFISQQYHIKTDTLKTLFKELSTQESIIEQIGDFVFTTDKDLKVLSANDSAKKIADISKESALTDLIALIDEKGNRTTREALLQALSSLVQNKPSLYTNNLNLTMKGYHLQTLDRKISTRIIIRVNPIISPDGSVERFIFLIREISGEEDFTPTSNKLQEAHRKYTSILDLLRKDPIVSKLITISLYLEILKKYEQDIAIASQFNPHPPALKIKMTDILRMIARVLDSHRLTVQKLNLEYKLSLPEDLQERFRLINTNDNLPDYLSESSNLSVTTDPQLLQILLEKTLEIVIAIAYMNQESQRTQGKTGPIELEFSPFDTYVKLTIKTKINPEPKEIVQGFLEINKGNLEMVDNLALSSSLESYIIKNITSLLSISFTTEYNQYNSSLSFNISINKYFNRPAH